MISHYVCVSSRTILEVEGMPIGREKRIPGLGSLLKAKLPTTAMLAVPIEHKRSMPIVVHVLQKTHNRLQSLQSGRQTAGIDTIPRLGFLIGTQAAGTKVPCRVRCKASMPVQMQPDQEYSSSTSFGSEIQINHSIVASVSVIRLERGNIDDRAEKKNR
jgi:hypothetical protein